MAELGDLVKVEITKPLPDICALGATYKIEGNVKAWDKIGAPPWVYAKIVRKEWYLPGAVEEKIAGYERGFPMPVSGEFTIDWEPKELGGYEITVVATPAPLPLPYIGIPPITGTSAIMKLKVEKLALEITDLKITGYELATGG